MIFGWRYLLLIIFVFLLIINASPFLDFATTIKSGIQGVKDSLAQSQQFSSSLIHDEAPENPPFGAVVAAAQNDTDLDWMNIFKQK